MEPCSRPWHKIWPKSVPLELDYPETTIYEVVKQHAKRKPLKCAVVQAETGYGYTYIELAKTAARISEWLNDVGVGPGDQVLFSSFNTAEAVAGFLGVSAAGAAAVLVDPLTTSEDLRFQVAGRNIKAAILHPEFYERERAIIEKAGIGRVLVLDLKPREGWDAATLRDVMKLRGEEASGSFNPSETPGMILYYSGIAGRTMQTLHSHAGLVWAAMATGAMARIDEKMCSLVVAPITHVLGLQVSLATALVAGGTAVIMNRWDQALAARAIEDYGVTLVSGAPMIYHGLLEELSKGGYEYSSLQLAISAGAPLDPALQVLFKERLGVPLVQAYGMTETLLLTMQPRGLSKVTGTVGIPLPDVDAKVVDPENPSEEKDVGEPGELLVRAPWLMMGYEDVGETEQVFIGGWLRTGDILVFDENGLLYFRGVKKRMIKYKAYPIFPRDLELLLEKHPAVEKAYVYGEPDPVVGQKPVAKVVLRPEYRGKVSSEELLDYVNSRVAFYKKIRRIEIVEKL